MLILTLLFFTSSLTFVMLIALILRFPDTIDVCGGSHVPTINRYLLTGLLYDACLNGLQAVPSPVSLDTRLSNSGFSLSLSRCLASRPHLFAVTRC
ncbi:hypothetical protein EI94DRAFT_1715349 [Lactarius quietus]|nr:hypothetical protein EI94DRAFT_1715349 [Lactarius quietus]